VVRNTKVSHRLAFTLVELIFAIVIIAMTVLSLPIMTQVTQKGIESSVVQEAIFAASAELMSATTYYWDANSLTDVNSSHLTRVIDVANDCNATTNLRPGHISQPLHRRCLDNNGVGVDIAGVDGLESAIVTNSDMFLDTGGALLGTDTTGYKHIYKSTITVTQLAGNMNIKEINSTIEEDDGTTVIVRLRALSANIGEVDYFVRRF
jgi:competence protein ComGC